jgi:hypothetical protein
VLQFRNETPFAGSLTIMPDADGVDTLIAVVKGTFTLGAEPGLAPEQVPVKPAAEYWGDPATSSMKSAPELLLPKPGTDVLVVGSAHAPLGRPVQELLVAVQVGALQQVARVTGDRVWRRSGGGYGMTPAAPWVSMPLTWERSYGGREETRGSQWHEEARNPVGVGFRTPDGVQPVEGAPVPNVEHPSLPMTSWDSRSEPIGFGPVSPGWMPRRQYAGTYDEQWQRERAPYLPRDFDARFLHVAPDALISPTPLVGGEAVGLHGLSPSGPLGFYLPRVPLEIVVVIDQTQHTPSVQLDTVTIEPDAGRFTMLWRAWLGCDKRALRVREVRAAFTSQGAA